MHAPPVLDQKETEVTLAALRNRRAEIERWLDGPAKRATLSALGRVIAELEHQNEATRISVILRGRERFKDQL